MATETTHFLNVDLEIDSRWSLHPLVSALAKKVIVLYADRHKRTYMARLELARHTNNPNVIIRTFCAMIRALPRAERKLWTSAKLRDFSIGVKAGFKPSAYDLSLTPQTLKETSEINARIVFTLYASDLKRIDRMKDSDIDYSDIPALDESFFTRRTKAWPSKKPPIHPRKPKSA